MISLSRILWSFLVAGLLFANAQAQGHNVGDKARDFQLKNVDGRTVSLQSHAGEQGCIVVFTCNHCPFAIKYEDRIQALHEKFAAQGYPVIAINPNDPTKQPEDSFENMQVRAREKGFTFPYVMDETQAIARAYGATRTPHVYLLQRRGNDFVVRYIGAIDDNANDANKVQKKYLEDAIGELRQGRAVSESKTKAIGCTIKWSDA